MSRRYRFDANQNKPGIPVGSWLAAAGRLHLPLNLPPFGVDGIKLIKRITPIARDGK